LGAIYDAALAGVDVAECLRLRWRCEEWLMFPVAHFCYGA